MGSEPPAFERRTKTKTFATTDQRSTETTEI